MLRKVSSALYDIMYYVRIGTRMYNTRYKFARVISSQVGVFFPPPPRLITLFSSIIKTYTTNTHTYV